MSASSAKTLLTGMLLFGGCCSYRLCGWESDIRRESAREQATKDAQWAKEQADRDRASAAEEARREAEKRRVAAIDAEEKALSPSDRETRIRAALPDVCQAKRLLKKAADPAIVALAGARGIIRAAEVKQLAAERPEFEKSRGLQCADGSSSPSCRCAGNHQGCCSHHRGVAGCEPYPTAIGCP